MSWFNRHLNWTLLLGLLLPLLPVFLIPSLTTAMVTLLLYLPVLIVLTGWYLRRKGYPGVRIVLAGLVILTGFNYLMPGFASWFGGVLPIALLLLPNRNRNLLAGG